MAPARRSRLTPHSTSLDRRPAENEDRSEPATTATDSGSESRDSSPNQPPGVPPGQRSRHSSVGGDGRPGSSLGQPFPGPPAAPSYMQTRSERTDSEFTGRSSESDSGYARLDSRSERPGSRQNAATVHPYRRGDGRSDGEYASRDSSPDGNHIGSAGRQDSRRRGDYIPRSSESPALSSSRPGSALGHRRSPMTVGSHSTRQGDSVRSPLTANGEHRHLSGGDGEPRRKGSAGSAGQEFRLTSASPFREAELRLRSASPRDLERERHLTASPFREVQSRMALGAVDEGQS